MFRRIAPLPGIAILAIVIEHSNTFGIDALYYWTSRYQDYLPSGYNPLNTLAYYVFALVKQLFVFGVPVFFFVSGFFVAYAIAKKNTPSQWHIIKTRVLALLPPFFIWSVVGIALETFIGHVAAPVQYLVMLLGTYWFIPVLILFYLMSPWIIAIANRNWKLLLSAALLIQMIYIALKYTLLLKIQDPTWHSIAADENNTLILNWLFYFPFGVVVGLYISKVKDALYRYRNLILMICLLSFASGFAVSLWKNITVRPFQDEYSGLVNIIAIFYSISLILSLLLFDEIKVIHSKQLLYVGERSLGIYLTHFLFMYYSAKLFYHFLPRLLSFQVLFAAIIFVIGLGGALTIMTVLSKSPMKASFAYLFG